MNKCILMGRLTADPEVRYTENDNKPIAKFSLAVDRKFKREGQPTADFFNCTCFSKQAEFSEKYLKKGTKILLTGQIQNNNYTNRDGQTVYSVQVMVDEIEFAESKSTNTTPMEEHNAASNDGFKPVNNFMDIPAEWQEELPFV